MEHFINQSIRRIVGFTETGMQPTARHSSAEQRVMEHFISIGSCFNFFSRKYRKARVGLPDVKQISTSKAALLAKELENAFNALGQYIAFPANLPLHLRYPFLRKLWLDNSHALYHTPKIIEPCREHELDCPFVGYCNLCTAYDEGVED